MRYEKSISRFLALALAGWLLAVGSFGQQPAEDYRYKPSPDKPPVEQGEFREADLVELKKLDKRFKLDIRYATKKNFTGKKLYKQARAFLQRPAAEALVRVHERLRAQGYGIVIFDGYRPWAITKLFWDVTPPEKRDFVADPNKGSRHNRGCAIDLSLYDLKTGKTVPMPSEYDEMSDRAAPDYKGGTDEARRLRDLLRAEMEKEGFTVYKFEWWHFDYKDFQLYRILDIPFSEIGKKKVKSERKKP